MDGSGGDEWLDDGRRSPAVPAVHRAVTAGIAAGPRASSVIHHSAAATGPPPLPSDILYSAHTARRTPLGARAIVHAMPSRHRFVRRSPSDDEAAADFAAAGEQATHGFAPAVLQLFATLDQHHPHEPHDDLPIIGTRPERQGRAIGSALLTPKLQRCDQEQLPAYLEATSARNQPPKEQHGVRAAGWSHDDVCRNALEGDSCRARMVARPSGYSSSWD